MVVKHLIRDRSKDLRQFVFKSMNTQSVIINESVILVQSSDFIDLLYMSCCMCYMHSSISDKINSILSTILEINCNLLKTYSNYMKCNLFRHKLYLQHFTFQWKLLVWSNWKFQKLLSFYTCKMLQNQLLQMLLYNSNIIFCFVKIAKQIKFQFYFCRILNWILYLSNYPSEYVSIWWGNVQIAYSFLVRKDFLHAGKELH